jgi:hypothetical protein
VLVVCVLFSYAVDWFSFSVVQCQLTLYETTTVTVGSEELLRMVRHLTTGMDGSKTWLPWIHQPTSGMDGSWCGSRQLECVVEMDGYFGMLFTTKS